MITLATSAEDFFVLIIHRPLAQVNAPRLRTQSLWAQGMKILQSQWAAGSYRFHDLRARGISTQVSSEILTIDLRTMTAMMKKSFNHGFNLLKAVARSGGGYREGERACASWASDRRSVEWEEASLRVVECVGLFFAVLGINVGWNGFWKCPLGCGWSCCP